MNSSPKIIAIVGMPGSGKSVAADFFRSKNIPILRFGDQTDIGLKELGLQRNEKNERQYREELRRELGMAAMAIKIEPRIEAIVPKNSIVVLDGLYSWEEYLYLSKKFSHITLLCIYTPPLIRYERLKHRPIRPLTVDEAKSRDYSEIENLQKGGPIAIADYLVKNETTQDDFHQELETFLRIFYESH